MDFNRLYSDHQKLLIEAEQTPSHASRQVHEVAATLIAGRIGCLQRTLGATAASSWELLAALPASVAADDVPAQGHGA